MRSLLGKAPRAVALACASFVVASGLVLVAGASPSRARDDAASAPHDRAGSADAASPPAVPACVRVTTSSRYIPYGYSHVVVLANACAKDATCAVSTDVNPEKQSVGVAKGATVEVVTFLASPQQTFTANVSCTLR